VLGRNWLGRAWLAGIRVLSGAPEEELSTSRAPVAAIVDAGAHAAVAASDPVALIEVA